MPATYEPIQTLVANGSQSTITFSSIPQTYTDLVLVASGNASTGTGVIMRFNNSSATAYHYYGMYGTSSEYVANAEFNLSGMNITNMYPTAAEVRGSIVNIFNYTSNQSKSILINRNEPTSFVQKNVCLWTNGSAITRIDLVAGSNYDSGTRFTIYGIKAA